MNSNDYQITFVQLISFYILFCGLGGWIGGAPIAILAFLLTTIVFISNRIKTSGKASSEASVKTSGNSSIKPKAVSVSTELPKIRGAIDHVQFNYKTQDMRKGTYTVAVQKFSSDKFTGYCYERNGERSFFPDSIVGNEVVRTSSGEVLTVDEWLAEHNRKLVEVPETQFENIYDFYDYAKDQWETDYITVLASIPEGSMFGRVGLFKKFKSGKPYKHPFIYLESRDTARGFLVSGKCRGRSYSQLDDAAAYFEDQAESLAAEAEA